MLALGVSVCAHLLRTCNRVQIHTLCTPSQEQGSSLTRGELDSLQRTVSLSVLVSRRLSSEGDFDLALCSFEIEPKEPFSALQNVAL